MTAPLVVLALAFVLFLSCLDLWANERIRAPARPRLSLERRCPYCHQELGSDQEAGLARCRACGTWHHEACLMEHGACSVYGCGERSRSVPARAQTNTNV